MTSTATSPSVEDVRDLMEEVVDDLYLRKFAHRPNEHGFTHAEAVTIARKVLDHPDARVLPAPSDGDDLNAVRARFAAAFARRWSGASGPARS